MHRAAWQKLLFSAAYSCVECRRISYTLHPWMYATFAAVKSRRSRCFRCGRDRVYRVDSGRRGRMSKHPISRLLGLLFAPVLKCEYCDLYFHDFRRPRPVEPPEQPG